MLEQHYPAGDVIYQEGDPSDAVYFINGGEIEVSQGTDGHDVLLGTLGAGDMLGETGVIMGNPRSTTARAVSSSTLLKVPGEEFLAAFGEGNDVALPLLRMLCERLRKADRRLAESEPARQAAELTNVKSVRLIPGTPLVQKQIGDDGVTVGGMPFTVGRQATASMLPHVADRELALTSAGPLKLSRPHFAIEELDGRLVVHDLDSQLGTIVNGTRISRYESSATAALRYGENVVVAGGVESQFRFSIVVEPREK